MDIDKASPLFTIVMAIRNVGTDLQESLDSFERQSYKNFEVVVADCNSTDDPSQYMSGRPFPIRHVVQGDKGIFDAWNKVLPLARGEWINFMGAGDHFVTDRTLDEVAVVLKAMPEDVLMAYGLVDVIGENDEVVRRCGAPWPQARIEIGRFDMFPHQATFQRRSTLDRFGLFDDTYRIAGDTEMILRLAAWRAPEHFSILVAHFRYGGTSSIPKNRLASVREMHRVMTRYGVPNQAWRFMPKARVVDFLYRTLPQDKLQRVIDLYRGMTGRKPRFASKDRV